MEYLVKFGIDVISKRNLISRKEGVLGLIVEADLEDVQMPENLPVIKDMIIQDVQPKIKQRIFNVEVLSIAQK